MLLRMSDVTRILSQIEQGDPKAAEELLPLVYEELRKLAAAKLAQEKPGQTLQATALVHEAYLRLVGKEPRTEEPKNHEAGNGGRQTGDQHPHPDPLPQGEGESGGRQWNSRGHFFAAAAEAMRRILIMNARRRHAQKRGGDCERIQLDPDLLPATNRDERLLALDEALALLEQRHPEKARLVKLRFFAGLTNADAAAAMEISAATADRHWTYARAWLQREMGSADAQ